MMLMMMWNSFEGIQMTDVKFFTVLPISKDEIKAKENKNQPLELNFGSKTQRLNDHEKEKKKEKKKEEEEGSFMTYITRL